MPTSADTNTSTAREAARPSLRVYLWGGVSLAALALLLLAVFAIYLFTRNLEMARAASRDRMANLAEYVVEHVQKDLFSYTLVLSPENMPQGFVAEKNAWLRQLAKATGLQHVALTDSLGHVYIAGGDTGTGAETDASCFDVAVRTRTPVYCTRRAGALSLQSLYHPFDFFGGLHLVILETDSNLLAYLEQYRTFIWAMAVFVACVLGGLVAALVGIDAKAREALQRSRRNEQLAFLGRTSAELAHELKNPLAIIKSSVDVLRRQLDPERKNQAFNFLSDEVMRLSRLITNILSLSRDRSLDLRVFPAGGVLKGACEAVGEIYPKVAVRVEAPEGFKVYGDADAVRQIVENLLRNAAQAMGEQGQCHVLCRDDANARRLILIGDEGPGIPASLRRTLFDPFVSGSQAGTGLGLAIVRNLVERMGWSLELLHDHEAANAVGAEKARTCFKLVAPATGHAS